MMMIFMYLFSLMIIYIKNMNFNILVSNFIYILIIYLLMNFINFEWFFISFNFSLNFYSYVLILMSIWISGLIFIMMSYECVNLFMLLLLVLMLLFSTMSILLFYFLFEFSLIIIFLVILKWGGVMRYTAGFYIMFYTLFFSMPLLVFLFLVIYLEKLNLMNLMELMNYKINMYMYMYMLLAFLIKIPMFMLHGWLLKAHVEAPVYGSMMLAALLLKLGTYGMLRIINILFYNMIELSLMIMLFSLLGSIYLSIVCLFQLDMKILVAYSSVVHMGLLLCSLMTLLKLGFVGAYMMMIAHGLCSSGLFYLVNLCYSETGSRLMLINKGMINYNSILSIFWFMLCSSNMSAPVSLNLISEVLMLMVLVKWFKLMILILVFFCFFSFCYSLYLFSYVQHGACNFYIKIKGGIIMEYLILIMHWAPLNLFFFNLCFFY